MPARRSGRHQTGRSHGRGWAVLGVIVTGAVVATLAFATTTTAAKILLSDGPTTTTGLGCSPSGSVSPGACPTAVPAADPDTQAAGPLPPVSAGSPTTERAPSTTAAPRDPTTAAARPSDRTTAADTPSTTTGDGSAVDQVLQQINDARAQAGLPGYTITAGLTTSADRHNSAMADGCGLSHQCPGEPPLGTRETDAGVDWSIAGENVGEGGQVSDSPDAIAQTARDLTSAMLNERPPDDGHRKNILSSAFHHIGIAIFRDSHGTVWLTQDFSN
jgi:uncharacterized protein YkwD